MCASWVDFALVSRTLTTVVYFLAHSIRALSQCCGDLWRAAILSLNSGDDSADDDGDVVGVVALSVNKWK